MFDGKIGLWPITEEYKAQRSSVNRPRGAVCIKNVSVDRELYTHYIINKVIPAIKAKWPRGERNRLIFIQQDNATPHVSPLDPSVIEAGTSDGFNIRLLCQPANSPDLNVLDLGFFASIQSIQNRMPVHGLHSLIETVKKAFDETSMDTLENVFITLQSVMSCILEDTGGNSYKIPHIGKGKLRARNELPVSLKCDRAVYDRAVEFLERAGRPMQF
jgi:hypothetical protein